MAIDPKLLDCLIKFFMVAHHENAAKAASECDWGPAQVSRRMKELPQEIQKLLEQRAQDGQPLPELVRGRTSELTEQGKALYLWLLPRIREICDPPVLSPRLRIGASHFILKNFARDLVVEFQKQQPDVLLDFIELRAGKVFERLERGEIDLGIGPLGYPMSPNGGFYTPSDSGHYRLRHQLIINAALREERRVSERPSWEELAGLPWIAYRKGTATRFAIDQELARNHLGWSPACEFEDEDIMRQLVDAQPRVALVSATDRDGPLLPGTVELPLPPMREVVLKLFRPQGQKKTVIEEAFATTLWRCLNG